MTAEQVQALLKELLEQKRYEQENTAAAPAIGDITPDGDDALAVTFSDGTRAFIEIYMQGPRP